MRIIQIAPDYFPLPPHYGGIERVVFDLTEALVKLGEEVFLYAPEGTKTSAHLLAYPHKGIWNHHGNLVKHVTETLPSNIDIIHDHTHFSVIGNLNLPIPTVCTVHMPVNNVVRYPIYVSAFALKAYGENYGYYVHNGINLRDFQFSDTKEDYLLFLGRVSQDKGTNIAIDIAERTGQKLIIAGPSFEPAYFKKDIKPRLAANSNISYIGEIGGKNKSTLLKQAKCLLFPSLWDEPFGLAIIEAMASGTPVLTLNNGAAPEVLQDFQELVCSSTEEMVDKLTLNKFPSPALFRQYVKKKFTRKKMALRYMKIYREVLGLQ